MNEYQKKVLETARKWYEAWGNKGDAELWEAVGEMCERENLIKYMSAQQVAYSETCSKGGLHEFVDRDCDGDVDQGCWKCGTRR